MRKPAFCFINPNPPDGWLDHYNFRRGRTYCGAHLLQSTKEMRYAAATVLGDNGVHIGQATYDRKLVTCCVCLKNSSPKENS